MRTLLLALVSMVMLGCNDGAAPAGPAATEFAQSNMAVSYTKEDTVPSIFVQIIPKMAGFNQDSNGYVKFKVRNDHPFAVSVQAQAEITGFTVTGSRTVDIPAHSEKSFGLFPIFKPGVFAGLNELTGASFSVKVDASYKTETISLLNETSNAVITARDVIFWAYFDKDSQGWVDLAMTIAGWVTPHIPEIDTLIRVAASLHPSGQLVGYQGTPDPQTGDIARAQVKAIYDVLHAKGVTYINSPVSYPQGTQRVKFPGDAWRLSSANCIDGTVLFASAIENIGLNPRIVLIPGHAFVAWETWDGSNIVDIVETTMVGTSTFEEANATGTDEYNAQIQNGNFASGASQLIDVKALRAVGITPLAKRGGA
jgi:hypothetical protein